MPEHQRVRLIWVAIFGTSVYLGLNKGIKRLSNFNVTAAFLFMGVFGLLAGLIRVFNTEITRWVYFSKT